MDIQKKYILKCCLNNFYSKLTRTHLDSKMFKKHINFSFMRNLQVGLHCKMFSKLCRSMKS